MYWANCATSVGFGVKPRWTAAEKSVKTASSVPAEPSWRYGADCQTPFSVGVSIRVFALVRRLSTIVARGPVPTVLTSCGDAGGAGRPGGAIWKMPLSVNSRVPWHCWQLRVLKIASPAAPCAVREPSALRNGLRGTFVSELT